jgi:imidazolonepropionase-like amidohydrolase/ketosteroid isomerase-like protein
VIFLLSAWVWTAHAADAGPAGEPAAANSDVAAARALFERNMDAIRGRDRATYLSLYLHSEALARTGPSGIAYGYDEFARERDVRWPDTFDATDIQLVALQPGVVYGTYRYRVRYGAEEHTGISERVFLKTADGWRIAVTGAIDAPPGIPPPPRAIVGATLIDGRGGAPVPDATIVMRGGKIDCAGRDCAAPEGVTRIDGRGLWVTPGLIDAHVHFSQTGWADGRPDSLDLRASHPYEKVEAGLKADPERFARSYICSGVTSVFDVGGYAWTLGLSKRFANDTFAPHVAAAGPLLSTLDHWLNLPAERQFIHLTDAASAQSGVDYLASQGAKAVKVWYIVRPPDLPVTASVAGVNAAGEAARKHDLPLIVHATGLAEAKAALRAGAKVLVHSVWDLPVDDEFITLARQNGTLLIPTLTVARGYVRMFQGVLDRKPPIVDDPNHCVDRATMARVNETATVDPALVKEDAVVRRSAATAKLEEVAAGNLRRLVAAGIPIATGTDAGNPLTLHGPAIYTEMDAMQRDGMTPMQVIVSSTAIAARAMGLDSQTGTIEAGKDADLLVLAGDPSRDVANFRKIRYVVRGGVVRGIEELSAMAQ